MRPDQERERSHFVDKTSGLDMEVVESQLLLDWLAFHYRTFGTTLEIITDKSQEGAQYVRGFSGIGACQICACVCGDDIP
ncbi:unnamed protein product [Protopolystoma xenopodis]|uniref:eRF1 domain-containing protein n=1 Tax=Protopolystoma xenopodis TaxID=117903 RepID=A0A448X4Y0_9PLAT|nr:unnamed protein product [Protopolystoma xenopodis]